MGVWGCLLYGAIGGFVNCLLFGNCFIMPKVGKEENRWVFLPGFLGNIIMGAAAGFLIDAFVASELTGKKEIALVILGGIGGGNVLISFLQQYKIKVQEDKADALANVSEEALKH